MAENARFNTHLQALCKTSELSDLTSKLSNGKILKVHKVVVCKSPFFKGACISGLKESVENVINFPRDNPQALEALVMLMYGFLWIDIVTTVCFTPTRKEWPIKMLPWTCELAKKYQLPDIADQLLKLFKISLCANYSNPGLNAEWCWPMTIYPFERDDLPEMRAELLATFRKHAHKLAGKEAFLREKLLKCPGLAIELALRGGLDGKGFAL